MKRKYESIEPITKPEAEKIFSSDDNNQITIALISSALYLDDWRWVQTKCLHYIDSEIVELVNTAVLCLGHVARLRQQLDLDVVIPKLRQLGKNPKYKGRVEDTLGDIEIFMGI